MTHPRFPVRFLFLSLFFAPFLFAQEVRQLETQTHRETWHGRRGVIKDVTWTFNPVLEYSGDSVRIRPGITATRHADNFAGVGGEIDFMAIDQAVQKIVLTLADGATVERKGSLWNFEAADVPRSPIVRLRLDCEVVGRTWSMEWQVERVLGPEEVALEFFDPASGRVVQSAADGASIGLRLFLSKENATASAALFTAEVRSGAFPSSSIWILEPARDHALVREFAGEARTLAVIEESGESPGTGATLSVGPGDRITAEATGASAAIEIEETPAEIEQVRFIARDANGLWRTVDVLPMPPEPFRIEVQFSGRPAARQRSASIHRLAGEMAEFLDTPLDPDALAAELPPLMVGLEPAGAEGLFQTPDLRLGFDGSEGEGVIPAEPRLLLLADVEGTTAVASAGVRETLKLSVESDRTEAKPSESDPLGVLIRLSDPEGESPPDGSALVSLTPLNGDKIRIALPLIEGRSTISFRWNAEEKLWVGSDGGGNEIADLTPGRYTIEATARIDRPGLAVEAGDPLTVILHPPPKLIVYDPAAEGADLELSRRPMVEHVIHDQGFRIGVIGSPFSSGSQPDSATVTLRSSVESITVDVPRIESGGSGLPIYDMRGDTVVTHPSGRPHVFPELLTHEIGETITVSHEGVSVPVKVSRDRYTREAREIGEVLKDYKAVFEAMKSLNMERELKREVYEKSNLLARAVVLHEFLGKVPTLPLIEISGGYLELIQKPLGELGRFEMRYAPEDFLGGAPVLPYAWDAEWEMLQARKRAGYSRAANAYWDVWGSILVGAAVLPYSAVKAIPEILCAPVYSGYTLYSGRQLDGQWASGRDKVFAGVDVALTLIPLAGTALKVARPGLYQRALRRLRFVDDLPPTRILPDEALSGPRWPELADRIADAEGTIQRHEAAIARLRTQLDELPGQLDGARGRVVELRNELNRFETEAPSARRMESNRQKLREREARFRQIENPAPEQIESYREFMRDTMAKLDKDREIFIRQQEALRGRLRAQEQQLRGLADEEARLRNRMNQVEGHVRNRQRDIERWRNQTGRPNPPAVARARSAAYKAQGNAGELIAFETLSRDGFIRHVERGGRMPNRLNNWKEVDSCLQVFQKTPEDLALRIGMDPDELRLLTLADDVPDRALLNRAREVFDEWGAQGIPYWPTGSVGPDGIYWNPRTNRLRVVEVKTGSSELGATQLTNEGIETWIRRMRGRGNRMYRPNLAEALTQALRSGNLERCLIRVEGREVVSVKLLTEVDGALVEVPIAGRR